MRATRKFLSTSLLVAILVIALPPQEICAQDVAAQIDQLVSQYNELRQFNGAVLVAQGENVIYENGLGYANMDWGIPNTPDTKFRIGSVTKQFTATIILKLVEQGKLSLDDKITDYLTEYPEETGSKVTIHHLLTHSSGIPSYTGLPDFDSKYMRNPVAPDSLVTVFSALDLEFEPGSEYRYSNSGYFLLGVVIEHVTGMPYDEALRQMVLDPLDLENTGYDYHQEIIEQRATGYSKTLTGYENAAYLDMSLPYAAGSMYSTVRDLHTWDQLLYTDQVFKDPHSKELMFTPYIQNYGYGWAIRDLSIGEDGREVKLVGHGGGINGFITGFWRLVDDRYVIIVMDNTQGSRVGAIQQGIANILYGEPAAPPKRSIAETLLETIDEKGVEAGVQRYSELKRSSPDEYDFSESELNTLGYHYLGSGDIETAIAVFELNVEEYPEASNTYDSLGEAYLEAGDTTLAIEGYQKSLELNPRNENGKAVLERLGVEVDEDLGKEIKLPAQVLERYVGEYEFRPGFILTVTLQDGQLMGQATGQGKVELFASSETQFFLKVVEARITFDLTEDGTVAGLTLYQGGGSQYAKKIN